LSELHKDSHIGSLKSNFESFIKIKIQKHFFMEKKLFNFKLANHMLLFLDELKNDDDKINLVQLINLIKEKSSKSLFFYYLITSILILIGICLLFFFLFCVKNNNEKWIEIIVSACITSISGFPIREIFNRRDRISSFEIIIEITKNTKDPNEFKHIREIIWAYIYSKILNIQTNGT
jgi:hypothetical protein